MAAYTLQGKTDSGSVVDIPLAAECDAKGNNIADTYSTKTELQGVKSTANSAKTTADAASKAIGDLNDTKLSKTGGEMIGDIDLKNNSILASLSKSSASSVVLDVDDESHYFMVGSDAFESVIRGKAERLLYQNESGEMKPFAFKDEVDDAANNSATAIGIAAAAQSAAAAAMPKSGGAFTGDVAFKYNATLVSPTEYALPKYLVSLDTNNNLTSTKVSDIKTQLGLGSLATKSTITSSDITDGTIVNGDISSSAGIEKGKLATSVQTSLGKADTALQSVPSASTTVTGGIKLASDTILKYGSSGKAVSYGVELIANRTYAVQKDSNGAYVVHVPWFETVKVTGDDAGARSLNVQIKGDQTKKGLAVETGTFSVNSGTGTFTQNFKSNFYIGTTPVVFVAVYGTGGSTEGSWFGAVKVTSTTTSSFTYNKAFSESATLQYLAIGVK